MAGIVVGRCSGPVGPWLTVFAIAACRRCRRKPLRETLTGGDLLANGVYVVPRFGLPCRPCGAKRPHTGCMSLAMLLLGVALTSRPNFDAAAHRVCGCRPPVWLALRTTPGGRASRSGFCVGAAVLFSMLLRHSLRCVSRPQVAGARRSQGRNLS